MKAEKVFESCDPIVRELYGFLMEKVKSFGTIKIDVKKTSIYVLNRVAFLGIYPKRHSLEINIVSDQPTRGRKSTQVNADIRE